MKAFRVTYQTVTPKSAEYGDFAHHGFVSRNGNFNPDRTFNQRKQVKESEVVVQYLKNRYPHMEDFSGMLADYSVWFQANPLARKIHRPWELWEVTGGAQITRISKNSALCVWDDGSKECMRFAGTNRAEWRFSSGQSETPGYSHACGYHD